MLRILPMLLLGSLTVATGCMTHDRHPEVVQEQSNCPSMEGTYQFDGSPYKFYLKSDNQPYDSYVVSFEGDDNKITKINTMTETRENRKKQHLDECTLLIPQVGMLQKVKKGESVEVLLSQEYTTKKRFTHDYALMVFAGFGFDIVNVKKISNSTLIKD